MIFSQTKNALNKAWPLFLLAIGLLLGLYGFFLQTTMQVDAAVGDLPDCTVSDLTQSECDDLVATYVATNGSGWNDNTGRVDGDDDLCDAYGVQCVDVSGQMYVEKIDLDVNDDFALYGYYHNGGNLLTGSLPVVSFPYLNYLSLGGNDIDTLPSGWITPLMERVYLGSSPNLTDISVFSGETLPNLQGLGVLEIGTSDLTPLSSIYGTDLTDIRINGSNVTSLGFMSSWYITGNGSIIEIGNASITDLAGMENILAGTVEEVNIHNNNLLTSINGLNGWDMSGLKELTLSGNPLLTDLSPLSSWTNTSQLAALSLFITPNITASMMQNLAGFDTQSLQYFHLNSNNQIDLPSLSFMSTWDTAALQGLRIKGDGIPFGQLQDISALNGKDLSSLKLLQLYGNDIELSDVMTVQGNDNFLIQIYEQNGYSGAVPDGLMDISSRGGGPISVQANNGAISYPGPTLYIVNGNSICGGVNPPVFLDDLWTSYFSGAGTFTDINNLDWFGGATTVNTCADGLFCNEDTECTSGYCNPTTNVCEAAGGPTTATITLNKSVINDNGGTLTAGDFVFTVDETHMAGPTLFTISSGQSGAVSGSQTYHVFEDLESGYTFVSSSCVRDGDGVEVYSGTNASVENYESATRQHVAHVPAVLGETYTCTIINDDDVNTCGNGATNYPSCTNNCASGMYRDGAACSFCQAGNYCPGGVNGVQTQCPINTYCPDGAGAPLACPVGTESPTGSDEITDCVTPVDSDGDGVSDSTEQSAPNGGDANYDTIADSTQTNVSTLPTTDGSVTVSIDIATTATSGTCSQIDFVESLVEGAVSNDVGYLYPFGLHRIDLPCETAEIKIWYHGLGGISALNYRKFNSNGDWVDYPHTKGIDNGIPFVLLTVTDNGAGDGDGLDNGYIADPGGLAFPAPPGGNFGEQSSVTCWPSCPGVDEALYVLVLSGANCHNIAQHQKNQGS